MRRTIQFKQTEAGYACFEDEERLKLWNDTGYNQLSKYLEDNNKLED